MENAKLALKKQMEELISESQDVYFSEYLRGLIGKLEQDAITTDYALGELNRTYNMYRQRMEQGVVGQSAQPVPQPSMQTIQQPQMAVPMQSTPQPQPAIPKKSNVEFAIGAGVLSIVGVLFVLIAFVMLGITYMNGFVKGMCMYVIALAILLFSELVLTKKMPKFAVGITALGISGLHLSTMLNYLYLENFNGWIAMALCVLISLIAVFISRKKDSGTIKIISFVGCYICVFPIGRTVWNSSISLDMTVINMHFLVVSAIIFIVNLMTIFLPVKKNQMVVHIFHLISNAIFSVLFAVQGAMILDEFVYILYFLISEVLVQGLIFYRLEKPQKKNPEHFSAETAGNVTAYVTTVMFMLVTLVVESRFVEFGIKLHVAMGVLLLVCIFLFTLFTKSKLKWIQYWLFNFVAWIAYGTMIDLDEKNASYWWGVGVILGLFLLSKVLSRVKALHISELIITVITAVYALFFFNEADMTAAICFLGAFLLSVIALNYWQSVYEEILLVVLELFVLMNFRNELTPAIMTGILFLGVIGFNNVEFFRGKYIKVFNYINLAFMVCLYIVAAFEKNHLSYAVMLVLGISFMVFAFREKYGMDFKIKHIIFVLFLCYMTLLWDIPIPVLKSIILMVIAIGAVTTGFAIREKKLRITGLALTLVVCGKIVLHDFAGAANTEKIILFLIVGLIVLAISGIYIALEKRIE